MRKGQKRREWIAEQKVQIVHKHLDEHISVRTLEKEYQADRRVICRAALHTSKTLSEVEGVRLMVAKLEIGNEWLKKDTWRKELVQTRSSLLEAPRV